MRNAARIAWKVIKVVLGLACLVWGSLYLATDTSSFPAVEAKVLSSTERIYGDTTDVAYDVKYGYQVDGTAYSGQLSSRTWREPGEIITVYYDPDDAGESYATQGQKRTWGIIILAVGLYLAINPFWKTTKNPTPEQKDGPAG